MADYYALQAAFTGGEISEDVASRVDIEKYQLSLLKAENVIIKPYGGLSKRPGMKFVGYAKYSDKQAVLIRFNKNSDFAYLLEFGEKYIRIWDGDTYTNIELVTPYAENDLKYLRTTQSADTMFICSRKYPVQVLKNNEVGNWSMEPFNEDYPYFDQSLGIPLYDGQAFDAVGTHTFTPKFTGEYTIEISGGGGGGGVYTVGSVFNRVTYTTYGGRGDRKVFKATLTNNQSYAVTVGGGGQSDYSKLFTEQRQDTEGNWYEYSYYASAIIPTAGGNSSFAATTANGGSPASGASNGVSAGNGLGGAGGYCNVYKEGLSSRWSAVNGSAGYVRIQYSGNNLLTPSAIRGNDVTITATKDSFAQKQVGSYIKLYQQMPSLTHYTTNSTTSPVSVGNTWKVISRGTWSGTLTIQRSSDMATWKEYRKWSSSNDNNVSEGGAFEEYTYLRAVAAISSGTCSVELTGLPYNHEGYGKIVEYISPMQIKVDVRDAFGSTEPTEIYSFSVWSDYYGYPACACFFQDRLVFAGNAMYPYMIWMSRSSDYYNFKVDKVSGTITDDSAIAVPVVSRELFQINHLVPAQDLIIMTNGNEWIISGDSVVTPTSVAAKMQTSRGSNECEPQFIGNRAIYVQRRGGTVRDMGYSFEQDNYAGDDLTQLARHLVGQYDLLDSTFSQDPYSLVYFVRSDGALLCLTYIREQKVFAWSKIITNGNFESVLNIQQFGADKVYSIVKRTLSGKQIRCIESFNKHEESSDINNYAMLDSYFSNQVDVPQIKFSGWGHLIGETLIVVADGRLVPDCVVDESGCIELELPAKKILAGLKYTARIEQPNFETQSKYGTMQGRNAMISEVTMRITNSLGGKIGADFINMDDIVFDEFLEIGKYKLFSGDKASGIPTSFRRHTRVCIEHEQPFPFSINALIRAVSFGG